MDDSLESSLTMDALNLAYTGLKPLPVHTVSKKLGHSSAGWAHWRNDRGEDVFDEAIGHQKDASDETEN